MIGVPISGWQECRALQCPQKEIWQDIAKLHIHFSSPAIPNPRMYPKETQATV